MGFRVAQWAADLHHVEAASLAQKYLQKSDLISEKPRVCVTKNNGQCHRSNTESTGEQTLAPSSNLNIIGHQILITVLTS
jgi:hypothetical protein